MEKKIITYKEYGAVGDGFTDDYLAIKAAHEAANEIGARVVAGEGRYYMGPHDVTIPIMTDTDWTGATIIIDDSKIKLDNPARTVSVFTVIPSKPRFEIDIKAVEKDAKKLDVAPGVPCMIHLECDKIRRYVRFGPNANNGEIQRELILVDAEGNIDENTPPMWSYPEVTKSFCIPIDEEPVTLTGGLFITVLCASFPDKWISYARNIKIARSNTTVIGLVHKNVGDNPYRASTAGIVFISYCNNILIKDVEFSSLMRTCFKNKKGENVLIGSYETGAEECNNITWENCRRVINLDHNGEPCTSGSMGTNRMKNVKFYNNVNMGFDAHTGLYNLHIKGGVITGAGIQGAGTAILEDFTMQQPYAMHLKCDYGSGWDGDFTVKNVTLAPNKDVNAYYIFQGRWVNHNFGYEVKMPKNMYVENLIVPDGKPVYYYTEMHAENGEDISSPTFSDGSENKNVVLPSESFTLKSKGLNFVMRDDKAYAKIEKNIEI